jgi:tungstate transport system substrate-binding protein
MQKNHSYLVFTLAVIVLIVAGAGLAGCTSTTPPVTTPTATPTVTTGNATPVPTTVPTPAGPPQKLILSTTTSLYDTGLLTYLKPKFDAQYNADLLITSQGTGQAIEMAKRGDADVLAVHSPAQEVAFMETGNGLNRRCFAYNYFVIIGPASDPAGIKGMTPEKAFTTIRTKGLANTPGVSFVSRGDNSGTHNAEKNIWKAAGFDYATQVQKTGPWYVEAGSGMGATLLVATNKQGYTLTDEGTFLAYKGKLDLVPLVTQGDTLLNVYSVMTVYNTKQPQSKIELANDFVTFMMSPQTQADIAVYGVQEYGKALFTPMNGNCTQFKCDCTSPIVGVKPLLVFHAGSLNNPFAKLKTLYQTMYPLYEVELFSGPSATQIEKITKANDPGDDLASADALLIPSMMYTKYADYYVTFAKNQMVIAYTNKSPFASEINDENWYLILNREGVRYATSDPNTDPAGYRGLETIQLAERFYGVDTIFPSLIGAHSSITKTGSDGTYIIDVTKTAPDNKKYFIAKTGPEAITMLKDGKADYAFEYSSVAIQNGLPYVTLPAEIDLSSQDMASKYATVKVKRVSGNATVTEPATPIIYGITVPKVSRNPAAGTDFIKLLIGPQGQQILIADGQTPIVPAGGYGNVPADLKPLVKMNP